MIIKFHICEIWNFCFAMYTCKHVISFSYIQPMPFHPYTIFPLGDCALTIDFGNSIDENINKKVLQLFYQLQSGCIPHIIDLIPAYSSLTVYYDIVALYQKKEAEKTAFEIMAERIERLTAEETNDRSEPSRQIKIPVCYAEPFALDIQEIAQQKNRTVDEIIRLHTAKTYRIFMIGFLPGFAYMGTVDERIAVPRKEKPRSVVAAGSVGIAGQQTGIYPLHSPGGWQIIGRTPLPLFDKDKSQPVLLQPGDEVTFHSITEDEFTHYQSRPA